MLRKNAKKFLLLSYIFTLNAFAIDANGIMQNNFMTNKFSDSIASAEFKLINKSNQERIRTTSGYTKLSANGIDNKRLVKFLSPSDIKDTTTLLIENSNKDDDMWIYLPASKKVRRLSAANKKDSFVGTDFSYGDVIGHKPNDWQHKLIKEEKIDSNDCYVIESLPKNDTVKNNTGYSKRMSWIDKNNFIALKTEFWDEQGTQLKQINTAKIKNFSGKLYQPMFNQAINHQSGHKTIIEYKDFKINQKVDEKYFTTRALEQE